MMPFRYSICLTNLTHTHRYTPYTSLIDPDDRKTVADAYVRCFYSESPKRESMIIKVRQMVGGPPNSLKHVQRRPCGG